MREKRKREKRIGRASFILTNFVTTTSLFSNVGKIEKNPTTKRYVLTCSMDGKEKIREICARNFKELLEEVVD